MAYHISLLAVDVDTGEVFESDDRILQVTGDGEPDFLSAVEMLHDELIDTEEKAEEYCQHI